MSNFQSKELAPDLTNNNLYQVQEDRVRGGSNLPDQDLKKKYSNWLKTGLKKALRLPQRNRIRRL